LKPYLENDNNDLFRDIQPTIENIDKQIDERIKKTAKKNKNGEVATALENQLGELEEELEDRALARQRLKDAEFVSQEEYDRNLKRRLGIR
jgi:hypothetical protein